MSTIIIAAARPTSDIEAVKFLRKLLKAPLAETQKKLALGEEGCFYTCRLFENDHPAREQEIRAICNFFRSRQIPLVFIEIAYDQAWADTEPENQRNYHIDETSIINMLDENKGHFE